jgi:hypothetical protein
VLADPLRDIGLRGHHALLDRSIPGELQVLFLAIGRIGDGTDGQDDFYQSALHTRHGLVIIIRPIHLSVSEFRQELVFAYPRKSSRAVNVTALVDKQLCRIAKPRRRLSRYDTSETTGLDIRRKRAMFQRYLMSCLGLQRVVRAALPTKGLPSGPQGFSKAVNFPNSSKKSFEWRNGT